ncbi:MAG: NIL domain-containing protein [Endomicrobiia bacterium]
MIKSDSLKKEKVKRLVLKFPKQLIDRPIVYHLVKDYDLVVNILKAQVAPDEEGILVVEISGTEQNYHRGIEFLKKTGVVTQQLGKDITLDKKKCTSCGVCVPLCPVGALEVNRKTFEVVFNKEKCIACELCIPSCPTRAIKLEF